MGIKNSLEILNFAELRNSLEQLVFGERFGQVLFATHHSPASFVKNTIFGGKHDDRRAGKLGVALDDGARLIAIESRHQNIAKDQMGLEIMHFGQSIEAIVCKHDLVASLFEEDFRASADGVAVVDYQHFDATRCAHTGLQLKQDVFSKKLSGHAMMMEE
jgi:hypothetical protein